MKTLGVNVLKAGMAKIAIILILRCNFWLQFLKQANNYFLITLFKDGYVCQDPSGCSNPLPGAAVKQEGTFLKKVFFWSR